jgi:glucose-6-phosphate isomerase
VRPSDPLEPFRLSARDVRLLGYAPAVARQVAALSAARFIPRMFRADPSLWASDPDARRIVKNRLGWLRSPHEMLREVPRLEAFAANAREDGMRHAVLLGMGGSSLCVEVFRRVFPPPAGFPKIIVLDSTVPGAVRRVESEIDPARTLFVVSSKSGTTGETLALQSYFWAKMLRLRGDLAGRHFVAITDPGTPLSAEASARAYRATFHNASDIGGRYSALSYFGLLPAALGGAGIAAILRPALLMLEACGPSAAASDNPGLALGAVLGVLARRGRDKVVLLADPVLRPFGLWIEQLLAESTGKEGRGLVPVDAPASPAAARATLRGPDRVAVVMTLGRKPTTGSPAGRGGASTPTVVLRLRDRYDLGAAMVQWEIATAVAGAVLGVNPFDEPNVAESKTNTAAALEEFDATGRLREEEPALVEARARVFLGGIKTPSRRQATLSAAVGSLLGPRRRADYVAVLAFVDSGSPAPRAALETIQSILISATGCAVTLGYGPRYLHSTGQLHKGGPNRGLFIEIVPDDTTVLPIPGRPHDLETFKQAQALGDYLSLKRRGRRIVRLRFTDDAAGALRTLAAALREVRAESRRARRIRS